AGDRLRRVLRRSVLDCTRDRPFDLSHATQRRRKGRAGLLDHPRRVGDPHCGNERALRPACRALTHAPTLAFRVFASRDMFQRMPRTRNTTTTTTSNRGGPRPPSIRGEKRVKETGVTIPVAPSRRKRGRHDGPTDAAAIDHRKQITGTDELGNVKGGTRRQKGGGAPLA